VTINVQPVNDAPVAAAEAYVTAEDAPLAVGGSGVLGNDGDVEGQPLSAVLVSGPAHGRLVLHSSGAFTYTPDPDYHGPDAFSYVAYDGGRGSEVVVVTLHVTAVADAPVAADDGYATDEDAALVRPAGSLQFNDLDADGDGLTVSLVSGPAHGTLELNPDGSFRYEPDANFNGTDSFVYDASDASGSSQAQVTIVVRPVNDAPSLEPLDPVAREATHAVAVMQPVATDLDGDVLQLVIVSGPAHGTAYVHDNGTADTSDDLLVYQAAAGYHGDDSFTFAVRDGNGGEVLGTASIVAAGVTQNPAPQDPTKSDLVVVGTAGDDHIRLERIRGNRIAVWFGDVLQGVHVVTGSVLVFGGGGNDVIDATTVHKRVELHGGTGNDHLIGGRSHDLLFGDEGDDVIDGRAGRDLLVGGAGSDELSGGASNDILVGGTTSFDADAADAAALRRAVATLWSGQGSYARRFAAVTAPTQGFLTAGSIADDGACDVLVGQSHQDCFFCDRTIDVCGDLAKGEQASELLPA
jgi:VCBS repeat-containing protein